VPFLVKINNMSVASEKRRPFNAGFSSGTSNNQLHPGQKGNVDALVLSHYSLLRNPLPKPTGVLEHCCERETNCWFSSFRDVSFWPHP